MKSLSSAVTLVAIGAALLGVGVVNGCGSTFEGCAASRSCPEEEGTGGSGAGRSSGGKGGSSTGTGGTHAGEAGQDSGGSGEGGGGPDTPGDAGQGGAAEGGAPAGGGTSGTSATGGSAGSTVVDTTPPEIVSARLTRLVAPDAAREEVDLDGATGVVGDTSIEITFSEPMDRTSAAAAFRFTDLGTFTIHWKEDDTGFTINPTDDLAYATGDAAVDALAYTISIVDTAADYAGNRMEETWTASFRTLRQVTVTLIADGNVNCRYLTRGDNLGCGADLIDNLRVGYDSTNGHSVVFLQFDLSGFPIDQIVGFDHATFMGTITGSFGVGGTIPACDLYSIQAHPLSSASIGTIGDKLADIPTPQGGAALSLDVLSAFRVAVDVREANQNLVQYRVSCTPVSSGEGLTFYNRFSLRVGYTLP